MARRAAARRSRAGRAAACSLSQHSPAPLNQSPSTSCPRPKTASYVRPLAVGYFCFVLFRRCWASGAEISSAAAFRTSGKESDDDD